jgi:hypothetical protein
MSVTYKQFSHEKIKEANSSTAKDTESAFLFIVKVLILIIESGALHDRRKLLDIRVRSDLLDVAYKDLLHSLTLRTSISILIPAVRTKAPVYVFNKEFFQLLRRANMDALTFGNLPQEFTGVFSIPETDIGNGVIDEIFVYCGSENALIPHLNGVAELSMPLTGKIVAFSWIYKKEGTLGYFWMPIDKDPNLNIRHNATSKAIDYIDDRSLETKTGEDAEALYSTLNEFLLSLLVYVNSGDPDMREFQIPKEFHSRGKHKKHKKTDRDIKIHRVGFEWKKYEGPEQWDVAPHWRQQRYGEGLQLTKAVFIKEQVRQRQLKKAN